MSINPLKICKMNTISILNEVSEFLSKTFTFGFDEFYCVSYDTKVHLRGRFNSTISRILHEKEIPTTIDANGYVQATIKLTRYGSSEAVSIEIILT